MNAVFGDGFCCSINSSDPVWVMNVVHCFIVPLTFSDAIFMIEDLLRVYHDCVITYGFDWLKTSIKNVATRRKTELVIPGIHPREGILPIKRGKEMNKKLISWAPGKKNNAVTATKAGYSFYISGKTYHEHIECCWRGQHKVIIALMLIHEIHPAESCLTWQTVQSVSGSFGVVFSCDKEVLQDKRYKNRELIQDPDWRIFDHPNVCSDEALLLFGQPIRMKFTLTLLWSSGTPTKRRLNAFEPKLQRVQVSTRVKAHPMNKVFRKKMPPEALDLVSKMLQYSPTTRCTAPVSHPFFDSLEGSKCMLANGKNLCLLSSTIVAQELAGASADLRNRLIPEHLSEMKMFTRAVHVGCVDASST
nr:shaggy-related protein kinase theta [Ipomoea batatas]